MRSREREEMELVITLNLIDPHLMALKKNKTKTKNNLLQESGTVATIRF